MTAQEWSYEYIDNAESIFIEDGQTYRLYSKQALERAERHLLETSHFHQEVASGSQTTDAAMRNIETVSFTSSDFAEFLMGRGFVPDRGQGADSASRLFVKAQLGTEVPSVGDVGPNGGHIFWVGSLADGSSAFLESAPSDWYPARSDCPMKWSVDTDLGPIQMNAQGVGLCVTNRDSIDESEVFCAPQFQIEQFLGEDWCLPTIEELKLMFKVLAQNGLGNFERDQYWSSSVTISPYVLSLNFNNGEEMWSMSDLGLFVRPVRLVPL